jgi:hypothetical protein
LHSVNYTLSPTTASTKYGIQKTKITDTRINYKEILHLVTGYFMHHNSVRFFNYS